MIPLIVFLSLGLAILILFEWRERHRKADTGASKQAPVSGCCGQHLVCEREKLLQPLDHPVYYDDEELDAFAGIAPEDMTDEQTKAIGEVFRSMRAEDVSGWVRSLEMRRISLPPEIREEALLIVREQRLAVDGQ